MKIKILLLILLTLALFTTGYAQALDKAKLDQHPGPQTPIVPSPGLAAEG